MKKDASWFKLGWIFGMLHDNRTLIQSKNHYLSTIVPSKIRVFLTRRVTKTIEAIIFDVEEINYSRKKG